MGSSSAAADEFNFPKIELHLHLDGAVRHSTIFELAKKKKIDLHGAKSVEDVKKLLVTHEPANLAKVLAAFDIFLPVIKNDASALERIAYETCEDQSKAGVIYFEGRYSPHLLCDSDNGDKLTPQNVIEAIYRGFCRGEKDFGVKARSILCCISGYEHFANEILELATNLKECGVVGIDVAGCSKGADEQYGPGIVNMFKEAATRGIHRTVHAGESGTSKSVVHAIVEMKSERIGHGYRITNDAESYQKYAIKEQIHFEACPYSSVMTGSVPLNWPKHPLKKWENDGVNFSISTDDPTCFDNTVVTELRLAKNEIGLSLEQLKKCQLNAAKSCFLPENEKEEIIQRIKNGKFYL
uniref:Adenosine deaminase n=1 Tax=Panagrolaimus sp. PS1159 TaxID=55785 RepID=A0AC35FBC6_9BILA